MNGTAPRLGSLDVFRGATVALMLLVNHPGSWRHVYPPLQHAHWHGWTLADLVFPFFLFAVGLSLALTTLPQGQAPAAGPGLFARHLVRRTVLIFALGLLVNAAPFVHWTPEGRLAPLAWDSLRLMGVLQRIALAWCLAALIVRWGDVRGALIAAALLLPGYWLACEAWARGGDPYSLDGFFGTAWDRRWLGDTHLLGEGGQPFDPEGLASTAPAVAQVLLGFLAGRALAAERARDAGLTGRLALAGVLALLLGAAWSGSMPFNKKLWTSSFVMLSTGFALLALAPLVAWVDRRGATGWPLRVAQAFGRHALAVFVLSGLLLGLQRLLKGLPRADAAALGSAVAPLPPPILPVGLDPRLLSLAIALLHVVAFAALVLWFDRRRWRLRV